MPSPALPKGYNPFVLDDHPRCPVNGCDGRLHVENESDDIRNVICDGLECDYYKRLTRVGYSDHFKVVDDEDDK